MMLYRICNDLAQLTGNNEKIVYLSRVFKSDPWIAEVFKYTYDSNYQFYLGKKSIPSLPQQVQTSSHNKIIFNRKAWEYLIKDILNALVSRALSGNMAIYAIEKMLLLFNNTDDMKILIMIILKDLRIKMGASSINRAYSMAFNIKDYDLISIPDTQLCNTYDPMKDYSKLNSSGYWYASRKLNGLRGRYIYNHTNRTFAFVTREDNPLQNFEFITNELNYLCEKYHVNYVDGEIYSPIIAFNRIISLALGNSDQLTIESKKCLKFNIFYAANHSNPNMKINDMPTDKMIEILDEIKANESFQYLRILDYEMVRNDSDAISELCNQYSREGYEGIILRHPSISWEKGRHNSLLKFKNFREVDLKVIGYQMGEKGKQWENYIVALICEGSMLVKKDGQIYVPSDGGDGSKFINIRVEASLSRCTLEDKIFVTNNYKDLYEGAMVEVRYQDITTPLNNDDESSIFSLQFPTYEKIKILRNGRRY